jgi:hypothetical protein
MKTGHFLSGPRGPRMEGNPQLRQWWKYPVLYFPLSASRRNRSDRRRCIFFIAASSLAASCWRAPLSSASRRLFYRRQIRQLRDLSRSSYPALRGGSRGQCATWPGVPLAGGLLGLARQFRAPAARCRKGDASDFDVAAFRALESIKVAVIALSFYSEQPQFNERFNSFYADCFHRLCSNPITANALDPLVVAPAHSLVAGKLALAFQSRPSVSGHFPRKPLVQNRWPFPDTQPAFSSSRSLKIPAMIARSQGTKVNAANTAEAVLTHSIKQAVKAAN